MRLPKPKRTKDKALLKALRIGYCELCGRVDMECGVHHIFLRRSLVDQACRLMGGLKFPRFGGGELGWQLSPLGCRPFLLPTRERHYTREMMLCRDEPPI